MRDNSKRFAPKLLLALVACVALTLSACAGAADDSGLLALLRGDGDGSALSVNGEAADVQCKFGTHRFNNCVF